MRTSIKLLGVTAIMAMAATALPSPAQAWWYRPAYYGPRVVIAPPVVLAPAPVYLPGPPVVYAPPVRRVWVPSHYNRYGAWVLGHWA